jgi:hypothetical protein
MNPNKALWEKGDFSVTRMHRDRRCCDESTTRNEDAALSSSVLKPEDPKADQNDPEFRRQINQ